MFQTKVVQIIKTILIPTTFFFFENLSFYEIIWENIAKSGRLQMIIRRMRIICWITKATDTHSEL